MVINRKDNNMPSPEKCKEEWRRLGYTSYLECKGYGEKKIGKTLSAPAKAAKGVESVKKTNAY